MNFGQVQLAKDAGCLAGSQGFCKTKMAEIQPSGGDERFFQAPMCGFQSVRHIGHQGDRASALDGRGELTLVLCAGAGHAAGQNLAALAGETAEPGHILVIDVLDLIHAKRANLPARLAAAGSANALASILRHIAFLLFGL
jgi:hypothetical protein